MLKNLFFLLTILTSTSLSAQIWVGNGNGSSWDDPANWSANTVPAEGANVTFPNNVTAEVSGTAPNAIRRIIFDTLSTVTLDLDLDFIVSGNPVHNIVFSKDANVTFGGTTEMRTFNTITETDRSAILINSDGLMLTITEQATFNVGTCQNGVRIGAADAVIINNGILNIANYAEHGINMIRGNFINNGSINIGTGVVDEEPTSDGINISTEGVFDNNAEGTITVTQPLDDGLEIFGTFNNSGAISTTSKDDAILENSGIVIGAIDLEGTMNNLASGVINTEGSIGAEDIIIMVQDMGDFNNSGAINVSSGNLAQAFTNRGVLVNEVCAHIDLIDGRISNNSAGMLTNNGLITSDYINAGVRHNAINGSALNSAFYGYANTDFGFSSGNAESVDNGQQISMGIVVNAENTCTIADIGIDVPYTWFTDLTGTVEAGTNDENGLLVLNDDIFAESGNHTLYTCFGEAVELNVQNISGDCALISSVNFIQLTDVFTLMPNPAQAFTQLKFGDENISVEKNLEVYNAIGQLVHKVDLNNIDNYILHTNNFATGIYSINVETEKGIQIERLVIQK